MTNITRFNLRKGENVTSFLHVRNCNHEKCPCADFCYYNKGRRKRKNQACMVEKIALNAMGDMLLTIVERAGDQLLTNDIMWKYLPLFHHLVKLMKLEIGLETDEIEYADRIGKKAIHPVYKEIRDVISKMNQVERDLGLKDAAERLGLRWTSAPTVKRIMKQGERKLPSKYGTPGFYEAMSKGAIDVTPEAGDNGQE